MPWKWCMGGGNKPNIVALFDAINAKMFTLMKAGWTVASGTTAPTAVQRWMVMGMREKLIELLEDRRIEASEFLGSMNRGFGAWYADHLIANGVTIPVRCKDCKHWKNASKPLYCSEYMGDCIVDDEPVNRWEYDFCSYGERKDNERKAD